MSAPTPDKPVPPPEAELIAERRQARIPRLSQRRAARLAGISPQSWANVESGRKVIGAGIVLPWKGTPDMLARMSVIAGVAPDELRELAKAATDRDDRHRLAQAADITERLLAARPSARASATITAAVEQISQATGLTDRQRAQLLKLVEDAVDSGGQTRTLAQDPARGAFANR